jgi:multicomponent Na+:H+ antiporter subunit E
MKSAALNLLIAVVWMLLGQELSLFNLGVGFVIGFVLLALFRPVFGSHHYVRRVLGGAAFVGIFFWAFISSCGNLAAAALFVPKSRLHPRLLEYDVSGLTRFEILLLSQCISLTPGTTTVAISPDFQTFLLHAFNTDEPEEVRRLIDRTLRRGILAFTR